MTIKSVLAALAIMCFLIPPAIAQDDPVRPSPTQPQWIPSTFCRQNTDGSEYDCGPVTHVPLGVSQRIQVPRLICRTCEQPAAPETVEITVLETDRDVSGETYTGADEEAVLIRLRVQYLSGPIILRSGMVRPYGSSAQFGRAGSDEVKSFWLASDGRRGHQNPGVYRQPALSPVLGRADIRLEVGQEAEGWIGGYVPKGTRQFALGLRTNNGGYVFFEAQPQ
jgi:hypothetical protein